MGRRGFYSDRGVDKGIKIKDGEDSRVHGWIDR